MNNQDIKIHKTTYYSQEDYTTNNNNKLKYVKNGYHYLISNTTYLMLFFITMMCSNLLSYFKFSTFSNFIRLWNNIGFHKPNRNVLMSFLVLLAIFSVIAHYLMSRARKVYLVEFACCKPHPSNKVTKAVCLDRIAQFGTCSSENVEFQRKLFERSGVGEETYLPEDVTCVPPRPTVEGATKEAEAVMFGAIDQLLAKTGVLREDIGILIVNCSAFNPSPSLCATLHNRYKLKEDVLAYNLGGMGCSAGLISIDLAKNLLQVHPNSYALIVSLESLTQNWYCGNNRSMLISNCLFRMGGAAILLSNKHSDRCRSKYQLVHMVRTHNGANDKSYKCAYQQEDDLGRRGIALSKDLMAVAGETLKKNITTLGPLVLPFSEQFHFLVVLTRRKIFRAHKIKPYVPDFRRAFDHFCIHAGGRAVLEELEKTFNLSQRDMEPSRMTLYRFGNTSSSSLWYELAYLEAKKRVKKDDRTWQIGFGSGFKCNSTVWCALRNINPNEKNNPWMDEIDSFPVNVPKVSNIIMPNLG